MAKIIWEGNQDWEKNFPDGKVPENAVKLKRPNDILRASLPYGIIPLLICFACIFYKRNMSDEFIFDLRFLHAVCYPKNAKVYIGVCIKKVAAYAISFYPISKSQFIIMSLAPMLLGIMPLIVLLSVRYGGKLY